VRGLPQLVVAGRVSADEPVESFVAEHVDHGIGVSLA
jgi:hypothetical protein